MQQPDSSRGHPPQGILWPALQVGTLSGVSGLLVGGVSGLIRSSTPALFALASGIQWFALGGTFWATRGAILQAWEVQEATSKDRLYASGIAGGFAGGSMGALTRGRANIIPGAIMFSIFGLLGQTIYNSLDAQHTQGLRLAATEGQKVDSRFWRRVADSKWSPMKNLSDEEYENMLRERLLRVNAEIALVDESIEKLRVEHLKSSAGKDMVGTRGTDGP